MMRKFDFDKSYEEVEICGKVYKVDFSDDSIAHHNKAFRKYYEKSQDLMEKDIEKMSVEEQDKILAEMKEMMKEVTESLLGEGAFDELYEKSGKSTANFMKLLTFLNSVFEEKTEKIKVDKRQKYVRK